MAFTPAEEASIRKELDQIGVRGDIALLATALLAPLEVPILRQQVTIEHMHVDRIVAAWEDLVIRVVGPDSGPVPT